MVRSRRRYTRGAPLRELRFNFAVSNPCFEYWLLLHFEAGSGVTSAENCRKKLVRYLPNFSKGHIEVEKMKSRIQAAIEHAEQKDVPPCESWPDTNGSTVYRLVKELLKKGVSVQQSVFSN